MTPVSPVAPDLPRAEGKRPWWRSKHGVVVILAVAILHEVCFWWGYGAVLRWVLRACEEPPPTTSGAPSAAPHDAPSE